MSIIELNMRLDVVGHRNSTGDVNERESLALKLLGICIHHRADFMVNGVKVPRLVAGRYTDGWPDGKLHHLAQQLHQDCIAVFFPDHGIGKLVGPRAAIWGTFDQTKFQRL